MTDDIRERFWEWALAPFADRLARMAVRALRDIERQTGKCASCGRDL